MIGNNIPNHRKRTQPVVSVLRAMGRAVKRPGARRTEAARRTRSRSALVALHGAGVARVRGVGILSELPLRAALSQQVPALVELLADVAQARLVGGRRCAAFAQAVLFVDQVGDVLQEG